MDFEIYVCLGSIVLSIIVVVGITIAGFFIKWLHLDKPKHQESHNGIVVDTIGGKRDIICPKCGCTECQYVFDTKQLTLDRYKTKTKVHLLNPFKPLVEEKTRYIPGQKIDVTKFRCAKCGWIFN